ncbi:DegT/DnrJ/EryC1/StrS family aminotransferase [Lachnobacterium bovis]|uniref:dTDP-4-amino-4,6-dideoxygalactose transaminase n=1 Tax=Lachnobacterium bovis TaxID=140626 RepID=A0A1H9T5U9_9FIRM|nr:DegT/DnrJ/EryC1/StrS family aminotransferase [Lachnobacterium bovis]SER92551.1 dTDP-4-amino-4,6-dideoxygalactose transaminase [Lachnobacterium bovis]
MDKIMVTRSSMPPFEEYIEEIRGLWDTRWLTNMGEKHEKLRKELKEYLKVDNIDLLVNGHMSLELSMQALGLKGEVITTPFTFASTTHAIVRNHLKPVFCDVKPEDFTIDPEKIEDLITDSTSAIVAVHVYGNVCDMEAIQNIADKYELKIIYDASHAFGITVAGKGIGSFGDVSTFSFHATKVFNTIEGGAVCFRDKEIGEKIYDLKNFGIHGPEKVDAVGANAKLNEFCAAMGLCNLRHVDEEIEKRKKVAQRYRRNLEGVRGIKINPIKEGVVNNYPYFPVIFDEKIYGASRNQIVAELEKNGIFARKYFYPITNTFDCYYGEYNPLDTPIALHLSKRVITLPMYADLQEEVVDRICEIVLSCRT